MNPKIKPCKCGGKAELVCDDNLPYVRCPVCGREGVCWAYAREAIHSWNGTPFKLTKRRNAAK
ncbi:hypothetical protein EOM81_11545 [bacterium]|nr:hypothetical protein [bacterium]